MQRFGGPMSAANALALDDDKSFGSPAMDIGAEPSRHLLSGRCWLHRPAAAERLRSTGSGLVGVADEDAAHERFFRGPAASGNDAGAAEWYGDGDSSC